MLTPQPSVDESLLESSAATIVVFILGKLPVRVLCGAEVAHLPPRLGLFIYGRHSLLDGLIIDAISLLAIELGCILDKSAMLVASRNPSSAVGASRGVRFGLRKFGKSDRLMRSSPRRHR